MDEVVRVFLGEAFARFKTISALTFVQHILFKTIFKIRVLLKETFKST